MATAETHTEIAYKCPACSATISVGSEFVGEQVDCPHCSTPFEAKAPEADPLLNDDQLAETADYQIDKPTDDETIIDEVHPSMWRQHPLLFVSLCAVGLGALALGVYSMNVESTVFMSVSATVLVPVIGYFVYWYLYVLATTLTITNKRTTLRYGIIAKSTTEVQHDDIRNLQVDQNAWQRILNVGDLAISSSGQDDLEVYVKAIPNPNEVADQIRAMQ